MDGSRGLDFDQSPEFQVHDWHSYFQRLINTASQPKPSPSSTPSSARLKGMRDPAREYHLSEFISVVTSFFKAVRTCLIAQNQQHIITCFEACVEEAKVDLEHNLLGQPASYRCQYAINVLARALRDVNYDWIKNRQLFHGRTQIDDLIAGVKRLENLGVPQSNRQHIAPVIQVPAARHIVALPSGAAGPYRSPVSISTLPSPIGRVFPYARYALGAILAAAAVGYAVHKEQATEERILNVTHYPDNQVHERRVAPPINHEIEFFRHTVDIVDPVKPHTSVVIHTLETAFARYPTQLSRCYIRSNPLAVHSSSELAHYVADHPQRAAHNLIQRVSRRRHDRTITIWWTENCHEIVIAPGVQTTFATNIRPSPVTILFTPPHP